MVIGVVVTHGNLAEELLRTARSVYGGFSGCYPLSNSGKSQQALSKELHELVDNADGADCVIFVDFMGGSCSLPCMKLAMENKRVRVISGVNLPIFLAFLNKRDEVPFDRLAGELVQRGQSSIEILDPESI